MDRQKKLEKKCCPDKIESCRHSRGESGRRQSRQTATTLLNVSRNWYGTPSARDRHRVLLGDALIPLMLSTNCIGSLALAGANMFLFKFCSTCLSPVSTRDNFWNWPLAFHSFSGKRNRISRAGGIKGRCRGSWDLPGFRLLRSTNAEWKAGYLAGKQIAFISWYTL